MYFGEPLGILPLGAFPLPAPKRLDGMPDPFYGIRQRPWWFTDNAGQAKAREDRLNEMRREIGLLPPEVADEAEDEADDIAEAAVRKIIASPALPKTPAETFARVAKEQKAYSAVYRDVLRSASQKLLEESFRADVIRKLSDQQHREQVAAKLAEEMVVATRRRREESDLELLLRAAF